MMPSSARVAALCMLAVVACSRASRTGAVTSSMPRPHGSPRNGLEVIGWMRFEHPSRALRTLAFTVTSVRGADTSTQSGYALLPGRLRFDTPADSRPTTLVRVRHQTALFQSGKRVATASAVDLRALLTFDVFAQAVDTTIMWLDSAQIRFGLARQDRFDGRRAWVVGAVDGDSTSEQFWVDADRWRLLRVIQRDPQARVVSDVRFVEYTELLDTPVPTRIEVWRDGRLYEKQTLSDFVVNPKLSSRAFDLSRWRTIGRIAPQTK
jgi:hypothetical protein